MGDYHSRLLPQDIISAIEKRLAAVERRTAAAGGGGGVSDHGALTGLGDDDHPQYHNDARALAWLGGRSIADLGTKDHAALDALDADDHAQYALLAGRSGGQTLYGGVAASERLDLFGNAAENGGGSLVRVMQSHLQQRYDSSSSIPNGQALIGSVMGSATADGSVYWFNATGTLNLPGTFRALSTPNLEWTAVTTPMVLFSISGNWRLPGSMGAGQVMFFAPTIRETSGTVGAIGMNVRALILEPALGALTTATSITTHNFTGMEIGGGSVDVSWNPWSLVRAILLENPAGSHATGITDLVGLDVPAGTNKATRIYTIRSMDPKPTLHHYGPVRLGTSTVTNRPGSILEIETNALGDHGSLTVREESNASPSISSSDRFRLYMKGDKLVVHFRDPSDSTEKFLSVPLAGYAGPYPQVASWTVDTAAP